MQQNVTCTGKYSCVLFLKAMNCYFSDQVNEKLQATEDIMAFAYEATSNIRKEMIGIFVA